MFVMTVVFGPAGTQREFFFNEAPEIPTDYGCNDTITITDSYGQKAIIQCDSIDAIIVDDVTKSNEAAAVRAVLTAKTNADIQKRVMSEPSIRSAMAMQQASGPIVMPGGRG